MQKSSQMVKTRTPDGIIHIQATSNNTIIVLTSLDGKVVDWISGGRLGLKGASRATSFAAERMTRWVAKQIRQLQWKLVKVWLRGFGQARFTAIRALSKKSKILLVKDVSRFPFGGCRPKKRGRI